MCNCYFIALKLIQLNSVLRIFNNSLSFILIRIQEKLLILDRLLSECLNNLHSTSKQFITEGQGGGATNFHLLWQ